MEISDYFYEAFSHMDRLGPGRAESTQRAAEFYTASKPPAEILDIGCGVGTHTFLLAQRFAQARITAIDHYAPYIDLLNQRAQAQNLSHRVRGQVISMFEMPFAEESFDLIWAEGSIYIAGFQRGLVDWKPLLKPNGYLICSEISWLKPNPSEESYRFWKEGYPEIDTIDAKINQIQAAGYLPKGQYICPVTDWTIHYYDVLQRNLEHMRDKYRGNETALKVVDMLQGEIDLYHRHSDDFSYVFYAMEKSVSL